MNYSNIKLTDVGNGPGVRVSLFVSGCNHACPGCFNQLALDFNAGRLYTDETIELILNKTDKKHIQGLSLLGGEPLDPANQKEVLRTIKAFRNKYGNEKDIWVWSGYIYDRDFKEGGRAYTEYSDEIMSLIDVLVDGPFVMSKVDVKLKFKGSSNQRTIDVKKSRELNELILIEL